MRTMHPVLKRGGLFWDRDLLPPVAYAERLTRIQAEIAAAADDAWLVYGDVERYGGLAYLSNFLPRTRSGLALVPARGASSLLISVGARDVPAAKTLTWIDDVRPFSRLPRQVVSLIEEKALAEAQIGLVSVDDFLSVTEWAEIEAGLPNVSWTSRTAQLSALREAKDPWEIEAVRRTAGAVEETLDAVPDFLRGGITIREAAAELDRRLRRCAAEDVRILVAGGTQCGLSLRPADDYVLAEGDAFMLYAAAEIQRYWAEAARTYVLGEPPSALQRLVERAAEALGALRAACVPGASVSDLYRLAEERLANCSLASGARVYGYGHGVGLDPEEAPFIGLKAERPLKAGATLALRIVGHENGLGVALGETVVVRESGGESLTGPPSLVLCKPGRSTNGRRSRAGDG